ncbi:MAG: hypothetical protein RLZZ393_373 [Pseudomonadota bacterium]|jgi:outer membrane receptor protein involved in Fe transport
MRRTLSLALLLAGGIATGTPAGEAPHEELDEIIVFGRAEHLIGMAAAASEGTVAGADLAVRPMLRVAELLEAVPGLIAAQHSGSGKANQYFLRGFNLDHGTDFTAHVDGMPWNLRTHGHGQGYLDVNGLIPEVVERIDYRKGPYRADLGDFSMAGASFMTTIDRLDQRFVAAETGQYGWGRLAGGGSTALGDGELTAIGQLKTYDGPWQRPEALRHGSVWAKYVQPVSWGVVKASVSGYEATWHPTEQAPEISVGTGACPTAYCSLDPSATGHTTRWILNGQLIGSRWQASGYAQFYDWDMFSDPTYDYQIHQFDRRWTAGGRAEWTALSAERFDLRLGGELRHDDIARVGVHHTESARFVGNLSDNRVREDSLAAFAEATWRPGERWRFTGGLRGDLYRFDVGLNPGASPASSTGYARAHQTSPKLGAAYTLDEHLELYANWGQGYHSNDARGVANPGSGVPGLVPGTGYEGGARLEIGSFKLTAAYWWLNLSSELVFVGDSNAVEPKAGARREGYELTAFWRPVDWLGLDAVYTRSRARYRQIQQDPDYLPGDPVSGLLEGHHVEGSVGSAGELGASALKGPWEGSIRLRYLGSYPLVPSGTRFADAELMVNLRLGYKTGRTTWYGELLNVMDEHGKDIVYFYPSFVPGVTPAGTELATRMSRAEEPRTVRLGVKLAF